MRNLELVDAIIALHEIARVVYEKTEDIGLSEAIRDCADSLHRYSLEEGRASDVADEIIKQVKE